MSHERIRDSPKVILAISHLTVSTHLFMQIWMMVPMFYHHINCNVPAHTEAFRPLSLMLWVISVIKMWQCKAGYRSPPFTPSTSSVSRRWTDTLVPEKDSQLWRGSGRAARRCAAAQDSPDPEGSAGSGYHKRPYSDNCPGPPDRGPSPRNLPPPSPGSRSAEEERQEEEETKCEVQFGCSSVRPIQNPANSNQ